MAAPTVPAEVSGAAAVLAGTGASAITMAVVEVAVVPAEMVATAEKN
jgi:hypothetical protein